MPPLVTSLTTLIAPAAAPEPCAHFRHGNTDLFQIFLRILDDFGAFRTNRTHQPLRDERFHHRSKEERLHIHVEQTGNAPHRIVRVERTEYQVTRHSRPNCDVGCLDIANFANHHHVWILPQNVSQPFGEREIDLRFHVDLRNTRQPIFHRFLNRDDPALDRIDTAEKTVERSRFAAAGRAGDKYDPIRLRQKIANDSGLLLTQVEALEPKLLLASAKQTQGNRFAIHRRNG